VVQLGSGAEAHPASVLDALPGGAPHLLPGERWVTRLPDLEAAAVSSQLSGRRGVNYVSPVAPMHIASAGSSGAGIVPNNPCYDASCGPSKPVVVEDPVLGGGNTVVHPNGQTDFWAIGAQQAWAVTKGSSKLLVAVLDTGVDPNQVQLRHKVIVGPDVCARDRPLCKGRYDANGHGTFVSGLIAAATNDGIGIAGLGWKTRVLDIKVLDDSGNGNTMDQATGIYDAVKLGARVIDLSSTNDPCSVNSTACGPNPDQEAAIEYAIAHGVVVVAAAGNFDSANPVYPADYPGVLSVAASTDQGVVDPVNGGPYLDFSDYGADANIAAPGINVLSTWLNGDYAVESGTSFAAPHVAAAAALVMAADPSLTGPQVATLLLDTATPLSPGGSSISGGLLNVAAAVEDAATHHVPAPVDGYQLIGSGGAVYSAGMAAPEGSPKVRHLAAPVVAGVEAPDDLGYWLVAADGGVFALGPGAHYLGGKAGARLSAPVTGMAATPDGRGYWLVTASGQVFAFGDAHGYGPRSPLSAPVTGMAATPDGRGYWLVTASGQVFAFGDAHGYGSASQLHLRGPVVAIVGTPSGHGYWLVAKDGGVFAFGDALYYGSAAQTKSGQAVVGMALAPGGRGYWLAGTKGKVWAFGSARKDLTETPGTPGTPIVAVTS
jgi:subtilisin family serine protease